MVLEVPSCVAKCPVCDIEMHDISEEKRCQQRADKSLLHSRLRYEVRTNGIEHEQVYEAEECAHVSELEDRDSGRDGEVQQGNIVWCARLLLVECSYGVEQGTGQTTKGKKWFNDAKDDIVRSRDG